jgi:diacylglycerol kinase family enzyme
MSDKAFNILINAKSGTVLNMGRDAIEAAITQSGIAVAELCFCDPENMQGETDRLMATGGPLIIGGGDGTLRESAKYLSAQDKAFGILPFGTMNLLANDLGMTSLQEALRAYAYGAVPVAIDAGFVNDEIFLCCASLGTMPQASVFREENRERNRLLVLPQLFLFVVNQLEKNKHKKMIIYLDGRKKRLRTPALVISANRFADNTGWRESNFKRHSLTGGELAVYAAHTQTKWGHVRLLLRMIIGDWLHDPELKEWVGHKVGLRTHRKHELVSIDGEVLDMAMPLEFTIHPKLVKLLVPAPPDTLLHDA